MFTFRLISCLAVLTASTSTANASPRINCSIDDQNIRLEFAGKVGTPEGAKIELTDAAFTWKTHEGLPEAIFRSASVSEGDELHLGTGWMRDSEFFLQLYTLHPGKLNIITKQKRAEKYTGTYDFSMYVNMKKWEHSGSIACRIEN